MGRESIMAKQDKNCIFCKIAKGEVKQEKIMESDSFFATRDIHPHAPGHTLVIPKQHYVTLLDIPNRLGNEMIEFTTTVFVPETGVGGYVNTSLDLVADFFGAVIAMIYIRLRKGEI